MEGDIVTRNVVVLCLDTVRADFFRLFAPRLRERAGIVYEGCRAASGWSTPSHASMLTGQLPHEHGVHSRAPSFDALDSEKTIIGDLSTHRAVGVSANVYAGSTYGFDSLFDEFVDVSRYRRFPDALDPAAFVREHAEAGPEKYLALARAVATDDRPLASLANVALYRANDAVRHGPLSGRAELFDDGAVVCSRAATERVGTEPFFLFVNAMDAHEPQRTARGYRKTNVPAGWDSEHVSNADVIESPDDHAADLRRYRTQYAAAIDYLDRWAMRFVDNLLAATDRETTVVVTADHGENLAYPADDRLFGHVGSLSEGVLHVPLVVINPPSELGTVSGYVSHLDLRRLIRGLANGRVPDVTRERAAAELLGVTPSNESLSGERWDRLRRCVYEGNSKWVWDESGSVQRFGLDTDRPCWQRDRSDDPTVPDWARPNAEDGPFAVSAATAARDADAAVSGSDADDAVDHGVADRLRELGYR
ncbi:sulfatase-like hydrolase/transferase [Haloarcula brevis]|uniref:sulfatase-like hydrolase/transferase n=1 Tax=Haloarcula brevis TaxID=3111453 RepID=UPI00300EB7FF